jgi:hypothetical protein
LLTHPQLLKWQNFKKTAAKENLGKERRGQCPGSCGIAIVAGNFTVNQKVFKLLPREGMPLVIRR